MIFVIRSCWARGEPFLRFLQSRIRMLKTHKFCYWRQDVEGNMTRFQWQNRTSIFSFWITTLLLSWRQNTHKLRCYYIGSWGGVCVPQGFVRKCSGVCGVTYFTRRHTTVVILVTGISKADELFFWLALVELIIIGDWRRTVCISSHYNYFNKCVDYCWNNRRFTPQMCSLQKDSLTRRLVLESSNLTRIIFIFLS